MQLLNLMAHVMVLVQVMETAITQPLAPAEPGRGAETEPVYPGEPLHTPCGDTPRRCAAVVFTSTPPSSYFRQTESLPHSACQSCPCATAHRDGLTARPHYWSVPRLRLVRTSTTPHVASKCLGTSQRFWAPRYDCPCPITARLRGVVGSCRSETSTASRSRRAPGATR